MDGSQVIAYVLALGIAVAIPGPGITALIARTLGGGVATGIAFMTGLMLGDMIYLSFAVFGLALVASTFDGFFLFIKWFSILYLCYLAWQFWFAEHHVMQTGVVGKRKLVSAGISGLGITLSNPKPIAFYLALLPLVIDIANITFKDWLFTLVPLTIVVLFSIGGLFIAAANAMRIYLAGHKAQKRIHRIAAVAMLGAAVAMILKH